MSVQEITKNESSLKGEEKTSDTSDYSIQDWDDSRLDLV